MVHTIYHVLFFVGGVVVEGGGGGFLAVTDSGSFLFSAPPALAYQHRSACPPPRALITLSDAAHAAAGTGS